MKLILYLRMNKSIDFVISHNCRNLDISNSGNISKDKKELRILRKVREDDN